MAQLTFNPLSPTPQTEDTDEAVMILEEITAVEEDIGVLEITITTTLLEEFTTDVALAQDRNVRIMESTMENAERVYIYRPLCHHVSMHMLSFTS